MIHSPEATVEHVIHKALNPLVVDKSGQFHTLWKFEQETDTIPNIHNLADDALDDGVWVGIVPLVLHQGDTDVLSDFVGQRWRRYRDAEGARQGRRLPR